MRKLKILRIILKDKNIYVTNDFSNTSKLPHVDIIVGKDIKSVVRIALKNLTMDKVEYNEESIINDIKKTNAKIIDREEISKYSTIRKFPKITRQLYSYIELFYTVNLKNDLVEGRDIDLICRQVPDCLGLIKYEANYLLNCLQDFSKDLFYRLEFDYNKGYQFMFMFIEDKEKKNLVFRRYLIDEALEFILNEDERNNYSEYVDWLNVSGIGYKNGKSPIKENIIYKENLYDTEFLLEDFKVLYYRSKFLYNQLPNIFKLDDKVFKKEYLECISSKNLECVSIEDYSVNSNKKFYKDGNIIFITNKDYLDLNYVLIDKKKKAIDKSICNICGKKLVSSMILVKDEIAACLDHSSLLKEGYSVKKIGANK